MKNFSGKRRDGVEPLQDFQLKIGSTLNNMLMGAFITKNAKLYPNKIAFICEEEKVTFSDYNRRVNQCSNMMLDMGLKKGDRLAVLAKNRLEYLDIHAACAKTGVLLEPLNWRFNAKEIDETTVSNGSPKAMIIESQFIDLLVELRKNNRLPGKIMGLDPGHPYPLDYHEVTSSQPNHEPELPWVLEKDDIIFICLTGGVTGVSKAAMLTHRNVFAGSLAVVLASQLSRREVNLVLGQLFHIGMVSLVYPTFMVGGTSIIMNYETHAVLKTIQKERVTTFLAIASMLNFLIDVQEESN